MSEKFDKLVFNLVKVSTELGVAKVDEMNPFRFSERQKRVFDAEKELKDFYQISIGNRKKKIDIKKLKTLTNEIKP
jgi:hypothetical protein